MIGSLRAKPGALASLTYRDALWPRPAYRRAFDALMAVQPVKQATRTMVALLALSHDSGREAGIAEALDAVLDQDDLPDIAAFRDRFTPEPGPIPAVHIEMPNASVCDPLLTITTDTARLPLLLTTLRLPTVVCRAMRK